MFLEPDDFKRLSFEVRQFLAKSDLLRRLSTTAQLYLEFPDVGSMHDAHRSILRAMTHEFLMSGKPAQRYVDDHTIALEPYAGVAIILTCKQRFAVQSGGSVGYRDIAFNVIDPPKDGK